MPDQSTNDQPDDTLVRACLRGDEHAWATFVERYTRLIYSIAYRSGLDDDDAADLVQNVFTIVLRRLESLQHVDRVSAWLITIAHRESWQMKRARQASAISDEIDTAVDTDPNAESLVVAWEHAAIVHETLRQLGERCRGLIERLFLREPRPSYETIAAEIGIAVGSIGPIRSRCLAQFRRLLGERGIVDAAL